MQCINYNNNSNSSKLLTITSASSLNEFHKPFFIDNLYRSLHPTSFPFLFFSLPFHFFFSQLFYFFYCFFFYFYTLFYFIPSFISSFSALSSSILPQP